jgi:osmotically inducible protein OsmC
MIKRTGSAIWNGGIKDGRGSVSTESGVLDNSPYAYGSRFEHAGGTNPEELIAAAHASCFTMAVAAQLGEAGMTAKSLMTTAVVTLDKGADGYAVSEVHLTLEANIPGAQQAGFEAAALKAKEICPISKLLNTRITLDARLERA